MNRATELCVLNRLSFGRRRLLDGYKAKGHCFEIIKDVPLYLATTPGDTLAIHGAWNFWNLSK